MVRFVFTVEDLARMRFAISPMWELVHSLLALRDPSTAALHLPWLKSFSGRLDGIALEPAVALIAVRGYSPDFINPPPASPLGDIADDLAALRATPDDLIRHDIALWRSQHEGVRVGTWLDDPRGTVEALADTLEAYWDVAMAPVWPRVARPRCSPTCIRPCAGPTAASRSGSAATRRSRTSPAAGCC